VQEFKRYLIALVADKKTLACFPDVITTHIHAVIAAVEHFTAFTLSTEGAHKSIF